MIDDEDTWDDIGHDLTTIPAWIAIGVGIAVAAPFVVADCVWQKLCDTITNVHKPDQK